MAELSGELMVIVDRQRRLETQQHLVKWAIVLVLILLIWRGYVSRSTILPDGGNMANVVAIRSDTGATSPAPSSPSPAAAPAPSDLPPAISENAKSAAGKMQFVANLRSGAEPAAIATLDQVIVDTRESLPPEEAYAVSQTLIQMAFADPRYQDAFVRAWQRCIKSIPDGEMLFPNQFDGQIIGPTKNPDGLSDYQLWGSGLRDPRPNHRNSTWYTVLFNYDPATRKAWLESLFISGKEVVHDWRPYGPNRIVVDLPGLR